MSIGSTCGTGVSSSGVLVCVQLLPSEVADEMSDAVIVIISNVRVLSLSKS